MNLSDDIIYRIQTLSSVNQFFAEFSVKKYMNRLVRAEEVHLYAPFREASFVLMDASGLTSPPQHERIGETSKRVK